MNKNRLFLWHFCIQMAEIKVLFLEFQIALLVGYLFVWLIPSFSERISCSSRHFFCFNCNQCQLASMNESSWSIYSNQSWFLIIWNEFLKVQLIHLKEKVIFLFIKLILMQFKSPINSFESKKAVFCSLRWF